MPLTRRNFLVQGSLSVAAGALATLVLEAEEKRASQETARQYDDWAAVRREFNLAPDYVHLGLFYIASHPRPVREAMLRAEGRVVHRGRTIGYVECDVVDENGKLIAKSNSTCLVLRGEKAAGR